MTDIYFRFKTDPPERPDQMDTVPDNEVEETKRQIIENGGIILETCEVSVSTCLARMENSHEL